MKINQTLFDAGCLSFRIPNPSLVRPFFIANMTSVNNFNEKKRMIEPNIRPHRMDPRNQTPGHLEFVVVSRPDRTKWWRCVVRL